MQLLPKLNRLPREARETLFVLLVVAWVLMPQVAQLQAWTSALAATLLLWRGYLALSGRALPGRWWLAGLLALTLAATLLTHRTLLGAEAGVALVVVLLALKTLEMRARRDAFVVFFLGFFAVLTQFFHSQSLATAAYMLVAVLGLLTALVRAHMPGSAVPLRAAARTAVRMAALGTPMMALLFVLFPRVAPLWGVADAAPRARSGLSATMSVGSMAELALDDSIAFRLRFDGPEPQSGTLYFRGPVLSQLDGRRWLPADDAALAQVPEGLQVQGAPLRYELTLEPSTHPWLMVLDATPEAPSAPDLQATPTKDLQWRGKADTQNLRRYRAQSYLQYQYGPRQWTPALRNFMMLPNGKNPRTLQWAAQLRAEPALAGADASALSERVLAHLRNGEYSYTLSPGLYGEDTADAFWFERKAGFCEHIASAYVVVMRALGVPARLVTGYQGAQRNAIDGYWAVRQSDAHAWAEIWQAGVGWVRVDPTAAVSPWRVGEATRLAAPRSEVVKLFTTVGPGLWTSARAAWEAANNRWNQWVLSYGQGTQMNLLKNLGFASPNWEDLGYLLAGVVTALGLLGAAWSAWPLRSKDPWLALLLQARKRLEASGLELAPSATPRQMAQQAQDCWGDAANALAQWLLELELLRYSATCETVKQAQLEKKWRSLPWPQHPPGLSHRAKP